MVYVIVLTLSMLELTAYEMEAALQNEVFCRIRPIHYNKDWSVSYRGGMKTTLSAEPLVLT